MFHKTPDELKFYYLKKDPKEKNNIYDSKSL